MSAFKTVAITICSVLVAGVVNASVELPSKYKNIVERNLFAEDAPAGAQTSQQQDGGKGFEPKEIQLYGIVSIGGKSKAFFKPSGQLAERQKEKLDQRGYLSLKIGDKLEGYTFKKLDERFAFFENANGNRLYVTLYDTQNAKKEYVNAPIGQAMPRTVADAPPALPPQGVSVPTPAPVVPQDLPVNHPETKPSVESDKKSDIAQEKLKQAALKEAAQAGIFGGPNIQTPAAGGTSTPSGPNPFLELLKKHRQ